MTTTRKITPALVSLTILMAVPMGCPTWRTEHKVETTHKIEAHIVLDIRQIQAEAAQVEGEVRDTPKATPDGAPRSSLWGVGGGINPKAGLPVVVASRSLLGVLDFATSAHAEGNSAERDAIARRKTRFAELDKALSSGCVGENAKGMIEPRPCADADAKDKKAAIERLAKDENDDRKIIYSAIAVRQGIQADQYEMVGEVYASEIRKTLKKDQPFQAPTDTKLFEAFQASPLGKSLPNARKGEWLKVP